MKTCWTVLGIPYSTDKQVVKRAYRSLMKQYHPDTVQSPEKKRKYTIKCYDINRAYEEAIWEVERGLHRTGTVTASNGPPEWPGGTVTQPMRGYSSFWMEYHTHVTFLAAISLLTGLGFFAGSPGWHILIHSVTLATLATAIWSAFVGCLLSGLIYFAEFNALFIFSIFMTMILGALGLATAFEKIWSKTTWTFMVCANVFLVYWSSQPGMKDFFPTDPFSTAYTVIFRVVFVSAAPFLFLIFWLDDLIRYRKVKDKVASILIAIG